MTTGSKSGGQGGDRLDSWKAIAAYLGKDVRTALRWAKDGGMPVYHHAGRKRGAVYAYRSELDTWIHADRPVSSGAGKKLLFRWLMAITILVFVAAVMGYWLRQVSGRPGLVAANPAWVLIADFDNRTGEERFDGTLETALRRELANSRHVLVVAPERIRETLVLMHQAPGASIDRDIGREICLRYGGIRAVLTGRVEKFDTQYLLSLEVVDPSDGRSVASAEERADGESEVLPAIHSLGNWVRQNLGEELARIEAGGAQLEKVTTPSLRALELYSKGMQFIYQGRSADAEALFREAVQVDPGFASANLYVYWTLRYQRQADSEEARDFLEQAMQLAATTSEQERLFIEGAHQLFIELDDAKACASYKTLAELFPDHYFAAGNAARVCGEHLGNREDFVRYVVRAAEQRPDWNTLAASALSLLEGDFERARPFHESAILRGVDQPDYMAGAAIGYKELFRAEEYLDRGMLPELQDELQRVEAMLPSLAGRPRAHLTRRLVYFYLALGQSRKAQDLGREFWWPGLLPAWYAFLAGDQLAFSQHVEVFLGEMRQYAGDPADLVFPLLQWNTYWLWEALPLDVLAPLYDPDSAVEILLDSGKYAPNFLTWPKFEAKLQLVRGKQLLDRGLVKDAIGELRSGVQWFREHGGWESFIYYFTGVEILAGAWAELGELDTAYRILEAAAGQRVMVNSFTAAQYQNIQARLARLARDLGHHQEAKALEADLALALSLADPDHPFLAQIDEFRDAADLGQ